MTYGWLANAVLVIHFCYVLFVVFGFVYIWIGRVLGWRGIYNRWFRWLHLLAMAIVAAETVLSIFCPLTEWESQLRLAAGQNPYAPQGFIATWVQRLLYYRWPAWVFTLIYLAFFAFIVLTFVLIPPRKKQKPE